MGANPTSIGRGGSSTLTWNTQNATDVSIDPLGPVQPNGSRQVSPPESTTYRLVAKCTGGTQEATAPVTVKPPAPQQPPAVPTTTSEPHAFTRNLPDAFYH